ncbi:MAG: hypothetical protein Fur0015_03440 [Ignavibacteriales bacterium]
MKTKLISLLMLIILSCVSLIAQDNKQEVFPEPVGGMQAIIKNLVYPKSAKDAGIQGKVFIKALVDENGNVAKTEVIKSLNPECDAAAISAIKKTKFTGGMIMGKPTQTEIVIPIYFRLQ